MNMGAKERKFHRLSTDQVTAIRPSDADESQITPDAHIKNISAGGVFIATTSLLPQGSVVEFEIKLPNLDAPAPVRGIVKHLMTRPEPGMGVEFLNIAAEHYKALREFCEAYGRRGA